MTSDTNDLFDPDRLRARWAAPQVPADAAGEGDGAEAPAPPPAEDALLARLSLAVVRELGPRAGKLDVLLTRARDLFADLREPKKAAAAQEELPKALDQIEDLFIALELGAGR